MGVPFARQLGKVSRPARGGCGNAYTEFVGRRLWPRELEESMMESLPLTFLVATLLFLKARG